MVENIKNIYDGLFEKTQFVIDAGEEFGYSPQTIKNCFVGGLLRIPEKIQKDFHTFIVNWARQEVARKGKHIEMNA